MIVMPSNNTGFEAGRLFGMFPGKLAHLHTPEAPREPKPGVPWALDNGIFGAWTAKREWSPDPFFRYLQRFSAWRPLWAVVPDAVGERERTLERWAQHHRAVAAFGVPLAFAVQDGMTAADVPGEAAVVFIGGSTSWKWRTLRQWCADFPRVHVGRVNTRQQLERAQDAGAESCDGTGWFRDPARTRELEGFLADPTPHPSLL